MIEYTARPVTRWVLTRYEGSQFGGGEGSAPASCKTICEVNSLNDAADIGNALAATEQGASYVSCDPQDLSEIPLLLRRIASQLESGELSADIGVLSLRAVNQKRPAVFGFGAVINNPIDELRTAIKELERICSA